MKLQGGITTHLAEWTALTVTPSRASCDPKTRDRSHAAQGSAEQHNSGKHLAVS